MPTPRAGYRLKDGTRVPSVTTILGRWKDAGGLIRWAYNMGREGRDMDEEKNAAADAGTLAHAWVDDFVCGREQSPPVNADQQMIDRATSALEAFKAWWEMSKVEIIATEKQLVSEQYRYGGTFDAIGRIAGKVCVIDWKTSNSVYGEYLVQLAAYKQLWEENGGEPIVGGFHLCRFSREHGDFAHHFWPDLTNAWRQFQLFREAYEIDKELKKRAA